MKVPYGCSIFSHTVDLHWYTLDIEIKNVWFILFSKLLYVEKCVNNVAVMNATDKSHTLTQLRKSFSLKGSSQCFWKVGENTQGKNVMDRHQSCKIRLATVIELAKIIKDSKRKQKKFHQKNVLEIDSDFLIYKIYTRKYNYECIIYHRFDTVQQNALICLIYICT